MVPFQGPLKVHVVQGKMGQDVAPRSEVESLLGRVDVAQGKLLRATSDRLQAESRGQ